MTRNALTTQVLVLALANSKEGVAPAAPVDKDWPDALTNVGIHLGKWYEVIVRMSHKFGPDELRRDVALGTKAKCISHAKGLPVFTFVKDGLEATVNVKPENMKSCDPPSEGADTAPPAPGAAGSLIPFPEVPFVEKTKADEEIVMLSWEDKQCGVTASCEGEKLHSATGFAVATVQLITCYVWKLILICAEVGLVHSTSHTCNNKKRIGDYVGRLIGEWVNR